MADGNGGSPLEELRSIIVGPEQHRLEDLEERLENTAPQAEDVSRVLPAAITLGSAQDDRLRTALAPLMEETIRTSVQRDPQPLADAIFPVIGPAIRKAISAALGGLVQTMNQALENTFSLRGLRWRLEAMRTGVSFGEIVLRNSLVYRVEQLFLVHREGGLLLQHVTADTLDDQSPEMVAGMLTAIQDFARDSFKVGSRDTLETVQVGELTVMVEEGPHALLAAVIRGHPPVALKTQLQQAVEMIHAVALDDLAGFNGDSSGFARVRPIMERCLSQEVAQPARKGRWRFWLLAAAVLAGLALWIVPRMIRQRHWNQFSASLRSTPGIIVTEAGRRDGKYFVTGFRDPAAASPDSLLKLAGIAPGDLDQHWEPYFSLDPAFAVTRARTLLAPEIAAIERQSYFYPIGQDVLPPEQLSDIPVLAGRISAIGSTAATMGLGTSVTILGQTDETGDREVNVRLGQARAEQVRAALIASGTGGVVLTAVGAEPPAAAAASDAGTRARRRRVSFAVEIGPR